MGISNKKDFEENKYSFNFFDNNTLKEQLNWGKRILEEANTKSLSIKNQLTLYQKEIHYFAKNITLKGQYQNGMCIILETSNEFQGMVLVCPIYEINDEIHQKEGLKIGRIFNSENRNDFIAAITEIKFINKDRFLYDKSGARVVGNITQSILVDIVNLYVSIIKRAIELPIVMTKAHIC